MSNYIYINNTKENLELQNPEKGNPGMGGTEFLMLSLPYYFEKIKSNKIKFLLSGKKPSLFYSDYDYNKDPKVLLEKLVITDTLIINIKHLDKLKYFLNNCNANLIIWDHNQLNHDILNLASSKDRVQSIICCSREQMESYLDHPAFYKSVFIPNIYDINSNEQYLSIKKTTNPSVCYVGNLIPAKGFHKLASIWNDILSSVPNAELNVIGSNTLYGNAEHPNYLQNLKTKFWLNDPDKFNVKFLGLLGDEKYKIIAQSWVGVVNPTGLTENCPGSALDFQSLNIPLVSAACNGLLDTTAKNETALLSNNILKQRDFIIKLLKNKDFRAPFELKGRDFVQAQFNPNLIISLWNNVLNHNTIEYKFKSNIFYRYKLIRHLNRIIRVIIPVPPLTKYTHNAKI